ncbi:CSC1-like protein 2 [Diaphorina citri]|uniref:CSC1-like protein 2 n=1 Tax=Diaphorina citri TaxID=121845 RepID=A0A3Q0J8B2_DIACI|nr:CSC1-like protein 2 [Diaphorina citri]
MYESQSKLLLMFFTLLRKRAWDYGRLALVQKNERWTQLFYGSLDEAVAVNPSDTRPPHTIPSLETSGVFTIRASGYHLDGWTQLFYGSLDEAVAVNPSDTRPPHTIPTLETSISVDQGPFSWLTSVFRIRDEHILVKSGADAVQYLSFQRHIIVFTAIITLVSLLVVLPVNFHGDLEGDGLTFGHTTLSNLHPESQLLWIHVTLAILYLPLSIFLMRRFSVHLKIEEREAVSKTLMITNIPRRNCDVNDIQRHFRESYPEFDVQDIQLAYDIARLVTLDRRSNRKCEESIKTCHERLQVTPRICGYLCKPCCYPCQETLDGLDYYTHEEARIQQKVDAEKSKSLKRPLGIAFVTMSNTEGAKKVLSDHRRPWYECNPAPPLSSVSHLLSTRLWTVAFAPPPRDIIWENLAIPTTNRYFKLAITNTLLFAGLFFLTTPVIVLNTMEILKLREIEKAVGIQCILYTFSEICMKTFISRSIQAFIEFLPSQTETYRWECLFLPDKGAFFVNYVITSSFIGTSLELIRFPELFMYAVRISVARSEAETASVRKQILWEFPFGVQYAWMLLIFALTTVYSLSCPLITPFGLLYLCLKHLVDRYNIYYAYGPSKISQQIHGTAINCVIASVVMLQASFTLLSILRRGFHDISLYALIGFILTVAFAFSQCFLRWFQAWSPIYYQSAAARQSANLRRRVAGYYSAHQYIPDVLRRSMPRESDRTTPRDPELVTVYSPGNGVGGESPLHYHITQAINSSDTATLYQNYETNNCDV